MTEIEITTAAERAPAETEPRLTLSQLQGLLREAAAIERARRPIVIHPTAEATTPTPALVPRLATVPAPGGAGVGYAPALPAAVPEQGPGWAVIRHRPPAAPAWGARLAYAAMTLGTLGCLGAIATDGAPVSIGAIATGLAGLIGGIARATHEQDREAGQ